MKNFSNILSAVILTIFNTYFARAQANRTLSNLTGSAVNVHLVPGSTNSFDLGGPLSGWRDLYLAGSVYLDNTLFMHNVGINNTFVGNLAGDAPYVTGNSNTGMGTGSLYTITSGNNNTALGFFSQRFLRSGNSNTAIGSRAGYNAGGSFNIAVGDSSLYSAIYSSASNNIAIGYQSMAANSSGATNIALGNSSLLGNTTGNNNTSAGYASLFNNTSGNSNTAIGYFALSGNTTGSTNTALGYLAGVGANNLTNATAIGAYAIVSASNSLILGNGAKVGIGVNTPGAKLHISGSESSPHGKNSAIEISNTVSGANWYLRTGAAGTATPAGGFSIADEIGYRLSFTPNGNVGINTTNPTHEFEIHHGIGQTTRGLDIFNDGGNGNHWTLYTVNADGELQFVHNGVVKSSIQNDGTYFVSDRRLKTAIRKMDPVLEKIMKLDPSAYEYINNNPDHKSSLGFIAQDIQPIFPELVKSAGDGQDIYMINYDAFGVIAIKAIQEQQKQIESQNALLETKDQEISSLNLKTEKLQNQLTSALARLDRIEQSLAKCCPNYSSKTDNSFNNTNKAVLQQNVPNPFNSATIINYTLSQQYNTAKIIVSNKSGKVLKELNISGKGDRGSVQIEASTLASGAYNYSLYINEKLIDTKQFLLQK